MAEQINSVSRATDAVNSAQTGMLYVSEGLSPTWKLDVEMDLQQIFNGPDGIITKQLSVVNNLAKISNPSTSDSNQLSAAVQEYSNMQNWLSTEMQGVNMMVKPGESISSSIEANYQGSIQQLFQSVESLLQVAIQNAGQQF